MCDREELMAYLDGEAPVTVGEHVRECADCQALAEELHGVSARMMEWTVEPPSAGLDVRVRAALAPERKPSMRRWWPWALGTATGMAVVVLVLSMVPRRHYSRESGLAEPAMSVAKMAEDELPASRGRLPGAPMIARTAQIALTTTAFDQTRAALDDILHRHEGYIGNITIANRTIEATLRAPAAQLDATLAEIRKLGQVQSESQSGEEVTAQYVDLAARLANARHTEQRLTDLLRQRTGDLADVLAVEKELDNTRGEIERMEAEEKAVTKRVDYATLNVTITEATTARPDASTLGRFRRAAHDGYETVLDGLVSVAIFLLAWGPSILLWGGLLVLAFWLFRRYRARRTT